MNKKEKILFFIFLIVFVGAAAFYISYTMTKNKNADIYEEMAESTEVTPKVTKEAEAEVTKQPEVTEEPVEIPVDFEKLWQTNRDIYAWIEIPGTIINYPIVQHESDNMYYLDHTVEGVKGLPGSIYTEDYNVTDFSDGNTVIYGHNMNDGSMFGSLSEYHDKKYGEKFSCIQVYTPEHILTYQVFAAVTYDDRHILLSYDANDKMRIQSFLNSLKEDSISGWIDETREVTADDRIIVLSTCNGNNEQRLLVGAVLTDEK